MATLSEERTALPATPAPSPRRRDIQGLRAVAVLSVVLFHAGLPLPGGFAGVDIFFVISGFVITGVLLRDLDTRGRIRFGRFYLRRFTRLVPALCVMVTLTLLASMLLLSPYGPQARAAATGRGATLLAANEIIHRNLGGYFDVVAESDPLLHTWSLSVEEQFYLVFPALLALAWSARRPSRRRAAYVVGTALGLSLLVVLAAPAVIALAPGTVLASVLAWTTNFYSTTGRAWEFGAGVLLALAAAWLAPRVARASTALAAVGAVLVAVAFAVVGGKTAWPGPMTLVPVVGCMLLLVAGLTPGADRGVGRLLGSRPMVAVGDWSYSIYLWHWPFIVWAHNLFPQSAVARPVGALLGCVVALGSYRWVEEPLRARRWPPLQVAVAVVVAVSLPIGTSYALETGARNAWWSGSVRTLSRAMSPIELGRALHCNDAGPLRAGGQGPCTIGAAGTPIYLLGDSHANQWSDAVVAAARDLHRPVTIADTSGCPLVDIDLVFLQRSARENPICRRYVQGTLDALKHLRPGLVVIANSDSYWHDERYSVGRPGAPDAVDDDAKTAAFAAGLERTVAAVRAAGHTVLVVQATPQWKGVNAWEPRECPLALILANRCATSMTTAQAARVEGGARAAVATVVPRAGGKVWDSWTLMCPNGICDSQWDGRAVYRDGGHITTEQSQRLAPQIEQVLRDAPSPSR